MAGTRLPAPKTSHIAGSALSTAASVGKALTPAPTKKKAVAKKKPAAKKKPDKTKST